VGKEVGTEVGNDMSDQPTANKSKEYIRPMPADWWMKKKTFSLFMVRELTCVFVGGYALYLLVLVARAGNADAFGAMVSHPLNIVLHIVALPMVLYHSITWFNLTPKVMVVWRGEERVSPVLIAGSNYLAWLIVSGFVAWIVLG